VDVWSLWGEVRLEAVNVCDGLCGAEDTERKIQYIYDGNCGCWRYVALTDEFRLVPGGISLMVRWGTEREYELGTYREERCVRIEIPAPVDRSASSGQRQPPDH